MKITHISVPYVYPLCPLNFNHTKMFVVADVYARHTASQNAGADDIVIFPIASHFSGNTAQSTSLHILDYLSGVRNEKTISVFGLYKDVYKVPTDILHEFTNPRFMMNHFNREIIWELKSLNVSCNYENAYTTESEEFASFAISLIRRYDKEGLLVRNENGDLALNYDEPKWRQETAALIADTEILQPSQRKTIMSAFENLSNGWELLRNTGYGVKYDDEGLIIDPMFDSELFMVFDLYVHWKNHYSEKITNEPLFFEGLLRSLKMNDNVCEGFSEGEMNIVNGVLNSLPCDVFFGEEHLKNWIGKKFFAEQKLLHPLLRTVTYRILGMGLLEGKRMSASGGHAIFTRDLINDYGGQITRLIILLSGGNVSRTYNYDRRLPETAKKMLFNFTNYIASLKSNRFGGTQDGNVGEYSDYIDKLINDGRLERATVELLVNIPARNKKPCEGMRSKLLGFYGKYLNIFLPGCELCVMP